MYWSRLAARCWYLGRGQVPEFAAGEQLHVVAERLGHADATVTASIYAHVTPRQRVEAAET